jgi:hypothetical protein
MGLSETATEPGARDDAEGKASAAVIPGEVLDFNVKHFHEKLQDEHAIRLSYRWVKTALQTAGLVKRSKKLMAVITASFPMSAVKSRS